jgi:hypothetical protein
MRLAHLVCPLCGKNSPLTAKKAYKASAEFPLTEDTPFIHVRDYKGYASMETVDKITLAEAMNDSAYRPYILMLRVKARAFLDLTS